MLKISKNYTSWQSKAIKFTNMDPLMWGPSCDAPLPMLGPWRRLSVPWWQSLLEALDDPAQGPLRRWHFPARRPPSGQNRHCSYVWRSCFRKFEDGCWYLDGPSDKEPFHQWQFLSLGPSRYQQSSSNLRNHASPKVRTMSISPGWRDLSREVSSRKRFIEGFKQGSAIEGTTTVSESAETGLSQCWAIEQMVGCPYRFNEKKATNV